LELGLPPINWVHACWFALIPLLWAQEQGTWKRALALGWIAGGVANLICFRWMFALMETHSGIPAPAAALLTLLAALQQGLAWGLWLALCRWVNDRAPGFWVYPVMWVMVEHFYPVLFRVYLANYQHDSLWISQCLDLAGPSPLSFVIVSVNVGLWRMLRRGRAGVELAWAAGMVAAVLLYGVVRTSQVEASLAGAERLRVGIVENDIGIARTPELRWQAHQRLLALSAQARAEGAELLVFPETAVKVPPPPHRRPGEAALRTALVSSYPLQGEYYDPSAATSPQFQVQLPLLMGVVTEDDRRINPASGRPARFNTALLLDADGTVLGRALKNHLLLFGEHIPGSGWFPGLYRRFLPKAAKLLPGTEPGVLTFRGYRLGISICYEDLLPEYNFALAQRDPHVLVNLTNDAWFGRSIEPFCHLYMARSRCIELRRFMVRATCTGVSALIDPLGRIVARTRVDDPEVLVGEVACLQGTSLFARVGNSFAWLCLGVTLWWLYPVMSRLRPRKRA
jgi:apolipoprotein N-acyltransferase